MQLAPTLWAEESPPGAWPTLDRDTQCEILVIGGGLAGLAVAGELEARGADVLVVDGEAPGAGASTRNAGFVLISHPWEHAALRETIGAEASRAMIAIARRTHARIEQDHGARVGHRRCGSLMLPRGDDRDEQRALERAAALLHEDGVATSFVDPPASLSGFGRALLVPEDGEVHPGALIAALAARVRRGAIARVTSLDPEDRIALAGSVAIRFERAIVATNAWTRGLVPELDRIVTPQRAQVIATGPLPSALERPCYATHGYDYFRQRADGSLIVGGRRHLHRDVEASDDASTTPAVQSSIEEFLREHLPFAREAPIARRWAGIMAFTPDRLPLVGALPGARASIAVLGGWNGHGLGLAIGCAERLAIALDAPGAGAIPRCLDPARFAGLRSFSGGHAAHERGDRTPARAPARR